MLQRCRQVLQDHPQVRDGVTAALWLVVGLLFLRIGLYPVWQSLALFPPEPTVFLASLLIPCAISTQRSRWPFAMLVAGGVVSVVDLAFGGSVGAMIVLSDLVYAAIRYGQDRAVHWLTRIGPPAVLVTTVALLLGRADDPSIGYAALQVSIILLTFGLWGWNVRSERIRTRDALTARHAEATDRLRTDIAHELHDRVANQIAVAALNIEAAKLHAAAVPGAAASLDRAKAGTERAHQELRELIRVLTTAEDPAAADTPGELWANLDALVPHGRRLIAPETGVDAVTAIVSRLPDDARPVVVRVLGEVITNAGKYGIGSVRITARETGATSAITVVNEVAPVEIRTRSTGIGLRGAGLLLADVGGALEAGAHADGTWRATIRIDREETR